MSDSVDYAALGEEVWAWLDDGRPAVDAAECGQAIAAIFRAHGWTPPGTCAFAGCEELSAMANYCRDHAQVVGKPVWGPEPLTGDALPSRSCEVCGEPAYFGERRCSKCWREPVPDRQCAWGGYECNEPVRGHKHFCDYHRTQHSP